VMTDSQGVVVQESDYYPFGGERVVTGGLSEKFKFAGMERDSESGLDHTLFRQYAWNLGRWLSPDPDLGSVLNPQSLNRYAYVINNPPNLTDPLGLYCVLGSCPGDPEPVSPFPGEGGMGGVGTPFAPFQDGGIQRGGGRRGGPAGLAVARAILRDAAKTLAKTDFTKKPECMKDFAALGVTAAQVQQGCTDAVFLNGIGSNVPRASLYANAAAERIRGAPGITGTVGEYFAGRPGTIALAELGGHDIYINPAMITASDYYGNQVLVLHEVLHNVSGLTDSEFRMNWGLPEPKDGTSEDIVNKLLKDCF
jgi:RHS repeat-associated protein